MAATLDTDAAALPASPDEDYAFAIGMWQEMHDILRQCIAEGSLTFHKYLEDIQASLLKGSASLIWPPGSVTLVMAACEHIPTFLVAHPAAYLKERLDALDKQVPDALAEVFADAEWGPPKD